MFRATAVLAAMIIGAPLFAGALYLEIGNPDSNAEAKAMGALVVARVTACHDPSRSVVRANVLALDHGQIRRTPLRVVPLAISEGFAVLGGIADGQAIELMVSNPEYKNYEPRLLIHAGVDGPQWTSLKRFFGTPPTEADLRASIAQ